MTSESTAVTCAIDLDGWNEQVAHQLWNAPESVALHTAIRGLASQLASLVDRPDEVTLVIAVDLADAVMRRDPTRPYSVERGSGMVAARTMPTGDGHIDVILDGNWLVELDNLGRLVPNESGIAQMRRSINHDAQHVIMGQRGADVSAYGRSMVAGFIDVHMFDAGSIALDPGHDPRLKTSTMCSRRWARN